ncbi:MAG: hypothetical protein ACO1TE_14225 [Prosthecobacter sp.]
MTARFNLEIPVKPKKGISGADMLVTAEIPFVPHVGMHLIVVPGDDYREVEEVYWSASDGVSVYFKFDEDAVLKDLVKLGWEEIG